MFDKETIFSAILFSLPILVLGSISSLIMIYQFDYYEKMWGKEISLNVSLCISIFYSVVGLLFFIGGVKFKKMKSKKAIAFKQKAFLLGVVQILLLFGSTNFHSAIFPFILLGFPFAFGMMSCVDN